MDKNWKTTFFLRNTTSKNLSSENCGRNNWKIEILEENWENINMEAFLKIVTAIIFIWNVQHYSCHEGFKEPGGCCE